MICWAKVEVDRHQSMMLAPSLDEQLGADHGIRVLDAMLMELDWSEWEKGYGCQGAGRPPIHPRLMAGTILFGLIKQIRSTRALEEATRMRLDFRWFLEGRSVDHTTFSYFRARFGNEIHDLFVALNRKATAIKKATLEEILIDGTRLRADSDRHGARTSDTLQKRAAALEEQIAEALAQMEQPLDEGQMEGVCEAELGQRLKRLNAEREKIEQALRVARERDEKKQQKDGKGASKVRVPVTDPDSQVMPNKEGGYAPNYTPIAAVDSGSGLIVGACMAEGNGEAATVPELMEQVEQLDEQISPQRASFDSGFAAGQNLEQLADAGVEVYAPVALANERNPAVRADPTQPVPEASRGDLPMRGKQFDKAAFIYEKDNDQYRCPVGRALSAFNTVLRKNADGTEVRLTKYRCADCSDCPLASVCLKKGTRARSVNRDQYEPFREDVHARMQTEQGRQIYARRAPIAEGAFGTIKQTMGIRRFCRRGRDKVAADWLWICTAYNLKKLLKGGLQSVWPGKRPLRAHWSLHLRLHWRRTAASAMNRPVAICRPLCLRAAWNPQTAY